MDANCGGAARIERMSDAREPHLRHKRARQEDGIARYLASTP
jgi:hypothetical protein